MSDLISDARGIDFHCHIDLMPDPVAAIADADRERIITLAMTTTPKAWPQNCAWVSGSRFVHAAVGLHPELAGERYEEISLLEEYIAKSRLVGEIGLDGNPKHRASWKKQAEIFVKALKRSQELGGRVLSIHSRRAADEVVQLLEIHTTQDRVLPILHWYSGSLATARKAIELGCYFSINPRMLESKSGTMLLRELPTDRMLIESDAPFGVEGQYSFDRRKTLKTMAGLSNLPKEMLDQIQSVIHKNAKAVLQFADIH